MEIRDKIYIDLDEKPVDQSVLQVLTYKNPEYFQKMNMGLPVWKIPKELKTYSIEGRQLIVFRGEYRKIKPYVREHRFDTRHPHTTDPKLQYINNDFPLDEFQERAIDAVVAHNQGIVHAVTSAGKSLIILKAITKLHQKALIVVHRKTLMQQFLDDIDKYIRDKDGNKIEPGIIGDGMVKLGPITVAIDKTLANNIDRFKDRFGVVILDECHLTPAQTMLNLINNMNSRYRFGFSGTLRRKDQKEFLMYATFGSIIATIGKEELLELNRVVPVEVKIINSQTQFDINGAIEELGQTKARALQDKTISLDPARNDMILRLVSKLPGKTMVLSRFVDPCFELSAALQQRFGLESGVITGKDSKAALEAYNAMKHKDLKIIFATIGCVSTGVSISDLNNLVLISPMFTNELLLHQIRGRLMRSFPGKTKGTLYYIYDENIFPVYKLKQFFNIMNA